MTFPMSELDKCAKIDVEEVDVEVEVKSPKEMEEEKQAEKEAQQKKVKTNSNLYWPNLFQDDIAMLICVIVILGLTLFTVYVKVTY